MLATLHDQNERWFQAWLDKDAATVERLMTADYVYVAPSGVVLDRAAILNVIRSPSYRLASFTDDQLGVMVWAREAGEWRLVMEQCSGR